MGHTGRSVSAYKLAFATVFFVISMSFPAATHAVGNMADLMCTVVIPSCPCMTVPGPNGCIGGFNMFQCPCWDITNDFKSMGKCMAPLKCLGQSLDGMAPMLPMLPMPMMMPMMMPMPTDTNMDECYTGFYETSASTSDPCARYNPNSISDVIGGGTSGGASEGLLNAINGSGGSSGTTNQPRSNNTTPAPAATPSNTPANTEQIKPAAPGLSGDVRIGTAGATIIANLREGLSEVAGFFGGNTTGAAQSLSVAGRLCSSRPWSGSFVSNLIPTSFFDGLCEWRGYQPGTITPQRSAQGNANVATELSPSSGSQPRGVSLPPNSNVPPEADIWAEPTSVRLGTRTYIFWNARGVVSCKESGPSFSQNSLSGGASTVPISGPTTFSIECLTAASSTIKDTVTVQLAI